MKSFLQTLMVLIFSFSVNASLIHYESEVDPDPIKKKAILISSIKKSVTETQALLLNDYLQAYSIEDLEYLKKDAKEVERVLRNLESRAPDDGDEHGVGATN